MKPFSENLNDPREALVAQIRELLDNRSASLISLLINGVAATGVGQCKLQCNRMGGTKIGGIIFLIATEMTEADQRRFADFAQSFVQDISSGEGQKMEKCTIIDDLPRGEE